jgi:hypothetical protein
VLPPQVRHRRRPARRSAPEPALPFARWIRLEKPSANWPPR